MTVQLSDERVVLKKTRVTPAAMLQRLGSVRVSYRWMLALASWLFFIAVIYLLRVLDILGGR